MKAEITIDAVRTYCIKDNEKEAVTGLFRALLVGEVDPAMADVFIRDNLKNVLIDGVLIDASMIEQVMKEF